MSSSPARNLQQVLDARHSFQMELYVTAILTLDSTGTRTLSVSTPPWGEPPWPCCSCTCCSIPETPWPRCLQGKRSFSHKKRVKWRRTLTLADEQGHVSYEDQHTQPAREQLGPVDPHGSLLLKGGSHFRSRFDLQLRDPRHTFPLHQRYSTE